MGEEHKKFESPGTLVLGLIFLIVFIVIYFLNIKYLTSIWEIH